MPVTEHELREGTTQGQLSAPDFALSERDVRRKRPPLLAFLLRLDTLRKITRVSLLLTLDFFGVYMAILTALWLKAGLVSDDWQPRNQATATKEIFDFAFLLTVL